MLALSGFRCDAATGMLRFAPVGNADRFRCFWSMGTAWGVYAQELRGDRMEVEITVLGGSLSLGRLELASPAHWDASVPHLVAEDASSATVEADNGVLSLHWGQPQHLDPQKPLRTVLHAAGGQASP
jgi:hypothetical protein